MYIIHATPISRGTTVQELTYFSAVAYPLGALILVPLRNREVRAIVREVEEVRAGKAGLRASGFALKKIRRQPPLLLVTPAFVRAVERTAEYYATSAGAVLFAYLPKALIEQSPIPDSVPGSTRPRLRGFIVPRLYQGLAHDRIEFYRTAVREAFAAKGSVVLVTPTIADAERVFSALAPGVERYAYLLHSLLSPSVQHARIAQVLENTHPVLVVSTPGYLSLPRQDLTTIIMERESSSAYRTRARPFVDARTLAQHLAAELGGQLFLADLPLRVESMYRKGVGECEEIVTGHQRMHFASEAHVVSQKGEGRQPKQPFYAIGRDLLLRMHEVLQSGDRVFLYVARRGLSPITLCGDCGTTVTCRECGASVVLHTGAEENHFVCHACGAMRHARERCANCQSWRLETLGIGTELVEREVKERLTKANVQVLSADTAKTHTAATKIARSFYTEPGSVLIGTELALPYLTEQVALVGVVSLDSLLSLASWNVYERITSTITRLRELSRDEMLLQTRRPDEDILATALQGNFSGFYKSELRARKALGYPPYTVLIKVSVSGSEDEVHARMSEAQSVLAPSELIIYPRMLRAPAGKVTLHGFLRIARDQWPNRDLVAQLRSLSPQYVVTIDPDSIL